MRAIDADKLKPDCMTKDGRFAISQNQIANAKPIKPSTDAVSRQAIKEKKIYSEERHEYIVPIAYIDWLPPVTPTIPKGQWIEVDLDVWDCSECKEGSCSGNKTNFCPNCGADMREGEV